MGLHHPGPGSIPQVLELLLVSSFSDHEPFSGRSALLLPLTLDGRVDIVVVFKFLAEVLQVFLSACDLQSFLRLDHGVRPQQVLLECGETWALGLTMEQEGT
jgi:hypothetical protein